MDHLLVDFPDRSSTSFTSRIAEYPLAPHVEAEEGSDETQQLEEEEDLFICSDVAPPLIVDFPSSSSAEFPSRSSDSSTTTTRVAFTDLTQVKFVENLTIDHKQNLWLTESDMKASMLEKNRNIKMIKVLQRFSRSSNNSNSTTTECATKRIEKANTTAMGLEYYVDTTISMTEFQSRRDKHCSAVLNEQWRQCKDGGVLDPDAIGNVSREGSEWAKKRARAIGTIHADGDCKQPLEVEVEDGPSRPPSPSA